MKTTTLLSILALLLIGVLLSRAQKSSNTAAATNAPKSSDSTRIEPTAADLAPQPKIDKSDAEWKQQLTPAQFAVMRKHSTEPAQSSPLLDEHRRGVFHCAACDAPLFASDAKFESGTGWPSFYQPFIPANIGTSEDRTFFATRTEVHCARCGAHLGHVFDDGPAPSGLRYCLDGVALKFEPRP